MSRAREEAVVTMQKTQQRVLLAADTYKLQLDDGTDLIVQSSQVFTFIVVPYQLTSRMTYGSDGGYLQH